MAPSTLLVISLSLAIFLQGTLGNNLNCKDLDVGACAYAVESSGRRCVREKSMLSDEYTCATSEIVANKLNGLIETEECINACGVDRKALGISFDSLLDRTFAGKLCSNACYKSCPNIVDLYFNLAAEEGVYLPKFCEARKFNARREMTEISIPRDLGDIASSPGPSTETPSTLDTTQSLQASTAVADIFAKDTYAGGPNYGPYAGGPDYGDWYYAPSPGPSAETPSTLDTTQSLQASTVLADIPARDTYAGGPNYGPYAWGPDNGDWYYDLSPGPSAETPSTLDTTQSLQAFTVTHDDPVKGTHAGGPDYGPAGGPDYDNWYYAPSP